MFGLKALIQHVDRVQCSKSLDEKHGFFVLTEVTNKVSELHQSCPQAVWFFNSINGLSLKAMLANSKVYEYKGRNGSVELNEAYSKNDAEGEAIITPWGVWNIGRGLIHIDGERWERRRNMSHVHIEATSLKASFAEIL